MAPPLRAGEAVTAPVALLVTGSRSLAKQTDEEARRNITPASEAWARGILVEAIGALPPGSVLIHGGAVGPDSWAQEAVEARRDDPGLVYAITYEANGRRWIWAIGDGDLWWSDDRWHPADIGPLVRNRHMVEVALSEQVTFGREPRVLALVDSTSRTKGTGHTVGLARKAGYPVDRRVWPDPSPR